MINDIPKYLLIALVCTLIIEISIGVLIGIKDKKDIINITLVNILTNPILNSLCYMVYFYKGIYYYKISIIFLEIIVFIVEGLIYKKYLNYKKLNPFILSLILNVSSYGIGLIINNFI